MRHPRLKIAAVQRDPGSPLLPLECSPCGWDYLGVTVIPTLASRSEMVAIRSVMFGVPMPEDAEGGALLAYGPRRDPLSMHLLAGHLNRAAGAGSNRKLKAM